MKIDVDKVKELKLDLEIVLLLLLIETRKVGIYFPYQSTTLGQEQMAMKLGLADRKGGVMYLTPLGKQTIRDVIGSKASSESVPKPTQKGFDEFWETFPTNDKHGMWIRTRTLKSDKAKCIKLYARAIREGFAHEDLIKTLKWEVQRRKKGSLRENQLRYMKASSSWLQQKEYEVLLEEMKTDNIDIDTIDQSIEDENNDWSENMV